MNIAPDMWPADTEALHARIARPEAQSETRRLQIEYMKARIQAVERLADTAERMFATIPGTGMALEIRRALDVSPD